MRVFLTDRDLRFDRNKAWRDWLSHHCVDAGLARVPGWIETDIETRQVRYWGLDLNENGKPFIRDRAVAHSIHIVQLEARPSPLPFTE